MATKLEIESFHHFALAEIANGGAALSIDELFQEWRNTRPTEEELAESVAAVKAAYADYLAGDTGRPAFDALRETCDRLGIDFDKLDQ
jgi:hypothetical protein